MSPTVQLFADLDDLVGLTYPDTASALTELERRFGYSVRWEAVDPYGHAGAESLACCVTGPSNEDAPGANRGASVSPQDCGPLLKGAVDDRPDLGPEADRALNDTPATLS